MSEKPQLPFGWVVKQSKSYPDRVYYFNVNSGASTWEFPDLIKDYNVNPDAAGPISPPILSASLLSAGPTLGDTQGLQRQAQEPSFSPQFSEDDSPSDNSHRFGWQYGRHTNTYQQSQVPQPVPVPRFVPNPTSAFPDHRTNMSDPRITGKKVSSHIQERNFDSKGAIFGNRQGLFGAGHQGKYDITLKGLNDEPGRHRSEFHNAPNQSNSSLHVNVSLGSQSGILCGYSGTSLPQKSPLLLTPSPKTPDKCSNLQNIGSRTSGNRNFRSDGAAGSKFHSENRGKTSNPVPPDKLVSDKHKQSSGLINNPYSKALQILNKSAGKSLEHLGSAGRSNTAKSDKSLSKPKSVQSTVSDRKSLERELNKSLNKDLKEKEALVKALNKPLDVNLKQKEALARELNKTLERDLNDNITKAGKRKALDEDKGMTEKKRVKYDNKNNNADTKAQGIKLETKSAKRKSSEILKRDSDLLDSTDKRKVKKGAVDDKVSRNVVLKTTGTPLKLGTNSTFSEDLKIQASVSKPKAPSSSRSFTRQNSEDSNLSLEHPEDPDQSGILRQFIGDKDKLLSIQSWIDNLRDGAGSSVASVDSLSESGGDADDKRVVVSDKSTDCDSGYLSPPLRQPVRTTRGWPGEVKKSDVSAREISAMEIDDVELPESDVKFEEEDMEVDLMISEVREQMKLCPEKVCGTLTATVAELQQFLQEQSLAKRSEIPRPHSQVEKQLYIVVDTNVIISDLPFFQDLKDRQVTGYGKPVLFIPWIVLQELDSLKQAGRGMPKFTVATQNKANKGIKLLQQLFRTNHPQVKGQTPLESQEAARVFKATCNDDVILMSCLHYRENNPGADVVLLTNDNNLINKALVCGVNAYNRKDLLSGLDKLYQKTSIQSSRNIPRSSITPNKVIPDTGTSLSHSIPTPLRQGGSTPGPHPAIPGRSTSTGEGPSIAQNLLVEESCYTVEKLIEDIYSKVKSLLRASLGNVLEKEMEMAYSDMWQEIVFRKPPWSLRGILESIKKHWIAVFGIVFPRPLAQNIDYLVQNLKEEKVIKLEDVSVIIREAMGFLEKCVQRNMYGSSFAGVVDGVRQLAVLCDKVGRGDLDIQTISSLEDYLKQHHQSSQAQQTCDNTNLVNSARRRSDTPSSSHSGTRNIISSQPAGRSDNMTVTSPAGTLTPSGELAARKLQKIWQHIYACCDDMRKLLNSSGMGVTVLSAVEATLGLLVPAAKQIRTEYAVVLQLPLCHLPGHMDKIGNLANQCNNFFSSLQIKDDEPPVDAEHFLALFRNGQQRESLTLFLSQLDEMLCHLYKCVQFLNEGNQDTP